VDERSMLQIEVERDIYIYIWERIVTEGASGMLRFGYFG